MIDLNDREMVKEFMRGMGAKGGKARLKTMSKKARSASAKNAAEARWKKHREASKGTRKS
jgi:hypothetical protein